MELIKVNNAFFGKELGKCNSIETFVEYLIISQILDEFFHGTPPCE